VVILSSIQMLAQGIVREAAPEAAIEVALREFDLVYRFMYSRVGNPHDAEDLTQQVAVKVLPRLRDGWVAPAVRGYLYTTARSVLATFWARRGLIREAELGDEIYDDGRGSELTAPPEAAAWVERTLSALPAHYRQILELRFLRGY
jgi:RNA polymerase sigma-70 factor (ECF subfamily)